MSIKATDSRMVDISHTGWEVEIDLTVGDYLTVQVPAYMLLGSAVLELLKLDTRESFSPAKTIDVSTPSIIAQDVKGMNKAVLVLTTPDSAERDVRVEWFVEEED